MGAVEIVPLLEVLLHFVGLDLQGESKAESEAGKDLGNDRWGLHAILPEKRR
jgi:hypothetical protein